MSEQTRSLRIKTGSCTRLLKDLKAYEREEVEQRLAIQKLKESGATSEDIKRQESVLGETLQMLPDTRGRLEDAFLDLQALVEELTSDSSFATVSATPEWRTAQQTLNELSPLFD